MPVRDIRAYKNCLRERYKKARRAMPPEVKADCDERIRNRVRGLDHYKTASTLLTFVSTAIEVDTHELIRQALADGKRVAVPRCVDNSREMEFYFIRSFDDLAPRTFGVLEPDPERCERLTNYAGTICIVPGLAFVMDGYRLVYGKGYYDRFLSGYPKAKIGVVYSECTTRHLLHGRFDVPVDLLVTEKYLRKINKNYRAQRRYAAKPPSSDGGSR